MKVWTVRYRTGQVMTSESFKLAVFEDREFRGPGAEQNAWRFALQKWDSLCEDAPVSWHMESC